VAIQPIHPTPAPNQVVIIAAGFDTRAYRLSRPGVKCYEIDLPHASDKKKELVEKLLPRDKVRCAALLAGAGCLVQGSLCLCVCVGGCG